MEHGSSYANGPPAGKPRAVAVAEVTFWKLVQGESPAEFAG